MNDFYIRIRSFQDILDFIELATSQPFRVCLGNDHQSANATSFMALVCLDHSRPLQVTAECEEGVFLEFRKKAARFTAT